MKAYKDYTVAELNDAAPVELNGIRGNMAVVVNMRNNKYYVHRILTPDGSEFVFDEKAKDAEPTSGELSSNDKRAPIGSAFGKSITQKKHSVNRKYSLPEKTSDTAYLAAVERGDMETAVKMRLFLSVALMIF